MVIIRIRRATAMKRYRIQIVLVHVVVALCSLPTLSHAAVAAGSGATVFARLDEAKLRESLQSYMGTRTAYGGRRETGIDCSRLTLAVIPRSRCHAAAHGTRTVPHRSVGFTIATRRR